MCVCVCVCVCTCVCMCVCMYSMCVSVCVYGKNTSFPSFSKTPCWLRRSSHLTNTGYSKKGSDWIMHQKDLQTLRLKREEVAKKWYRSGCLHWLIAARSISFCLDKSALRNYHKLICINIHEFLSNSMNWDCCLESTQWWGPIKYVATKHRSQFIEITPINWN